MKVLKATVNLPYATPDGAIVVTPGFKAGNGVYANIAPDAVAAIPEKPSGSDIISALMTLWMPWSGYRFATATDRAAMLSAIITAVCRAALDIAPGYFFDAPVQASGKTKCAGALVALMRGKRGGITPFVEGSGVEAETVKKLVAMLLGGESSWLIDNVVGTWRSPVIAGLITSGNLSERILGGNTCFNGDSRLMICATGNNAALDRDLGRRMIRVRIDPGVETPQSRNFSFDPIDMALAKRQEIAQAVLVVIRAFWQAKPKLDSNGDAGFSEWNKLVRQCVLWVGSTGYCEEAGIGSVGDPAHSIMEDSGVDDPDVAAHRMLLTGLNETFNGVMFQAKDVLQLWELGERRSIDEPNGMIREALTAMLGRHAIPSSVSLGRVLRNRRDRWVSGLILRQAGKDRNDIALWMVATAGLAGVSRE
ncbi:hypothetical protein [Rugamonas sp.]|uniref:hypothetical protein n=1 Tax=Rugamonas sp. TaxID=1926287 RepID=UPI0025F18FC0|nr:hypothetical protein [Rugamonas sp.]